MKRAIFSVYKKDGLEAFAAYLAGKGYEIVSTGGTYRYLKEKGVPVTEVSAVTGFPEVLDGRVKTLHPAVHAGILAMRDHKSHMDQIAAQNFAPVDFVVVNLYPFEETISKTQVSAEEIIEQIDIGGVTLIRAAAKNHRDVTVVVDNADCERIRVEMDREGRVSEKLRTELAAKAFGHTACYDGLIAQHFLRAAGIKFPSEYAVPLKLRQTLRYGENPHQLAGLYRNFTDKNISTLNGAVIWGKEMSYNNYLDADACLDIVREFAVAGSDSAPFCAIVKHTNPCGAAVGSTLAEAFDRAKAGDPASAYGGIVGFSRILDKDTAQKLLETFFEIILAPGYEPEALSLLKTKKNLRILDLSASGSPAGAPAGVPAADWSKKDMNYRRIEGGMLVQDWDTTGLLLEKWDAVTERKPSVEESRDLKFAWKIAKYVKSNAIVYVKNEQVIGVGAGQMSRVDSARIGIVKAEEFGFDVKGSVLASDAFFPFRDTVDNAAKAGVTAIVQPGGSVKDDESIAAANENHIAMVFTGIRHFRH